MALPSEDTSRIRKLVERSAGGKKFYRVRQEKLKQVLSIRDKTGY